MPLDARNRAISSEDELGDRRRFSGASHPDLAIKCHAGGEADGDIELKLVVYRQRLVLTAHDRQLGANVSSFSRALRLKSTTAPRTVYRRQLFGSSLRGGQRDAGQLFANAPCGACVHALEFPASPLRRMPAAR